MFFWPSYSRVISCVTANNIAIGEGGNGLLICGGKPFCQTSAKNRYFCNVSQQVFSGVVTCTSPKAKSTISGLYLLHTTVFARCVRKPFEAVFESSNLRRLACLFLTTSLLDLLGRILWNRYVDVKESFKSTWSQRKGPNVRGSWCNWWKWTRS